MKKIRTFLHGNIWILLLDVAAVNLAYYGALLIRFFVNFRFTDGLGRYLELFCDFAPFYTILAIIVFYVFHLYGGIWKYAGLNDLNRILLANAVTAVIQVFGTLVFVARMPISYYLIGSFLQLFFMIVIRFSQFLVRVEKNKLEKDKNSTVPAMIIGSGEYGRRAMRHLEEHTTFRAVVIAGKDIGRNMDGIPVVPPETIADEIRSRGIKAIFIADEDLAREERERIKAAGDGLEIRDYTGYLSNMIGAVPLSSILEITEGPVTLSLNGRQRTFESAREALETITRRFEIKSISTPLIRLEEDSIDESWISEYQNETGEEVSFF